VFSSDKADVSAGDSQIAKVTIGQLGKFPDCVSDAGPATDLARNSIKRVHFSLQWNLS
jgi:hypothetical protein